MTRLGAETGGAGETAASRTPKVRQPTALDIATAVLKLPQSERPINLTGKVGLITGGTNGIGASSFFNLLDAGAQVVTMSRKGADQEFREAAGQFVAEPIVLQGDLTDSNNRQQLVERASDLGNGGLDFVVLNASGVGPDVNVTANADIVMLTLDRMRPGGVYLLEQSVAHYYPSMTGVGYDEHHYVKHVCPAKYEGEQNLWALEPEMRKRGLKLYVKVSPVVEDSRNVIFFRVLDKRSKTSDDQTIDGLQKNASEKLGLPTYATITEIGRKTRELMASGRPSGYVELHRNNIHDVKALLRHGQNHELAYPDTLEITGNSQGVGRMLVPNVSRGFQAEAGRQTMESIAILQHMSGYDDDGRRVVVISKGNFRGEQSLKPGDGLMMVTSVDQVDNHTFGGVVYYIRHGETEPHAALEDAQFAFCAPKGIRTPDSLAENQMS